MHTCYFSKRCRFCQAFLEELSQTPFFKEVRFVCVDPSPSRPPLPAWLKSVPALMVEGENSPRVGPSAVNNWLFERRLLGSGGSSGSAPNTTAKMSVRAPERTSVPTYSADVGAASSRSSDAPASSGVDPAAWHGAEMGGNWSDAYSFVDDTFTSEKGINPIVRNFELLQDPNAAKGPGGGRATAAAPAAKRSVKEEKLLQDFEAFTKSRDMEFSGPRRIG